MGPRPRPHRVAGGGTHAGDVAVHLGACVPGGGPARQEAGILAAKNAPHAPSGMMRVLVTCSSTLAWGIVDRARCGCMWLPWRHLSDPPCAAWTRRRHQGRSCCTLAWRGGHSGYMASWVIARGEAPHGDALRDARTSGRSHRRICSRSGGRDSCPRRDRCAAAAARADTRLRRCP